VNLVEDLKSLLNKKNEDLEKLHYKIEILEKSKSVPLDNPEDFDFTKKRFSNIK